MNKWPTYEPFFREFERQVVIWYYREMSKWPKRRARRSNISPAHQKRLAAEADRIESLPEWKAPA